MTDDNKKADDVTEQPAAPSSQTPGRRAQAA